MQVKIQNISDLLNNIESQQARDENIKNVKINTFNVGNIEKSFKSIIKKDDFSPIFNLEKSKLRKIKIKKEDYFYYESESITKTKEIITSLDMDDKFFNHSSNKIFFLSKNRMKVDYVIIKDKYDNIVFCMKENYIEATELLDYLKIL